MSTSEGPATGGTTDPTDASPSAHDAAGPDIVVSGGAAAQEVAAVVAVLAALSGGGGSTERVTPPSRWASPRAAMRSPVGPGPGAWRASARP